MVSLVLVAQTLENRDRLFLSGLADLDGLETSLESRVLLDVLAVLVEGCRADHLEIAACKRGLEDIRGVRAALCRACADDCMELVDKENRVLALLDLVNCRLDSLLKVAAVFCARDHACEIEGDDALVAENFRDIARGNLESKPLGYGGFADARLADEDGVVLCAAREDLDHALDFLLSADDGVDFAVLRSLCQIPAELIESGAAARLGTVRLRYAAALLSAEGALELLSEAVDVYSHVAEEAVGVTVLLIEDREQDMLCADVAACARRKGDSRLQKPLCARSKGVWRELCRIARAGASDSAFEVSRVETACLERFGCNACAFLCKTEKNVLGANVVLTHAFGGLNREVYRLVCFLSEAFDVEHIHTPPCLVINVII